MFEFEHLDRTYFCRFKQTITMITKITEEENKVEIILSGEGIATIDWGDSSPNDTHTLDLRTEFRHTYTTANTYTITVTGSTVTELHCLHNQLTSLDVSKNTALEYLDCSDNQLTNLDVSKNIALEILMCSANKLTCLDVRKNTSLIKLYCQNNQITTLYLNKDTVFRGGRLNCYNNPIKLSEIFNPKQPPEPEK